MAMSYLLPFWRKEETDRTLKDRVMMLLFMIFLFSPSITFVVLYGTFGYPMEIATIYTIAHVIISILTITHLIMNEFMAFILSMKKKLLILGDSDRINKRDIYKILDKYYGLEKKT